MTLLSAPILAVALAAALAAHIWNRASSPLWNLPGPRASRLTSLVLRWHEFRAGRTAYIHALHLRHGPVVRVAPGEVSFSSYEAVKEIYGSQGSGYDKTAFYDLFRVFGRRTMFSTLNKTDHAKRKRLLADRYANSNVIKPASLDGINDLAREFARQCGDAKGRSVDIYIKLHSYACDGVTHHLFHPHGSDALRKHSDELMMHQVTTDNSLASRLVSLHYPTLYTYLSKLLHLFVDPRATPLADDFVLSRNSKPDPAEFTLLSRLQEKTASSDAGAGGALDATDTAAECNDHMVAGIDTSGDSLCFLMWQLSQPESQHYQALLREEIASSSYSLSSPSSSNGNSGARFDELPFLDAVVQEGLRCFPAIPMSLPRVVPEGGRSVVDGVFVPAGTVVSSQAYSVGRCDEGVFPEPDEFRPERWLRAGGEAERRRLMFAFSHGGRGCVGKHLALAEMKLLLIHVYSQFTTTPDPAMTVESMRMHEQIISARPLGQRCLLKFTPVAA